MAIYPESSTNTGLSIFCCQKTMSLAGKCSVVYSGARGIGRAYCEHLLQNGCKVRKVYDVELKID